MFSNSMIGSLFLIFLWLAIMRAARHSAWQVAIISLPGTTLHEISHLVIGFVLFAKPTSLSLFPKRQGQKWRLGSVTFTGLNILNSAPVAFAPLLLIGLAWLLFDRWMQPLFMAENWPLWILSGYFVASVLNSSLPSSTDVRMGWLSALFWTALGCGAWYFFDSAFFANIRIEGLSEKMAHMLARLQTSK